MSKRNFQISLLNYNDSQETNDPKEILFNNTEIFSGDLGSESESRLVNVPATQTNLQIALGMSAAKVLFIKNTHATKSIVIKMNSTDSNAAITIAPGSCMYVESTNDAGAPQITALYAITGSSAIVLKIFASS